MSLRADQGCIFSPLRGEFYVMRFKQIFKFWSIALVITLLLVAACIRWFDIPVARFFLRYANALSILGRGLSSSILAAAEIALIGCLATARLVRGNLPDYAKALLIACTTSLSAFAANEYVLKFIFGRDNPVLFLHAPAAHIFNLFQGNQHSSFPSGHMVMATAFAAVLVRLYPRTLPVFSLLLCIASVALVVGDWHFVSDVIAGIFVGATAGYMAGELWVQHVRLHFERSTNTATADLNRAP